MSSRAASRSRILRPVVPASPSMNTAVVMVAPSGVWSATGIRGPGGPRNRSGVRSGGLRRSGARGRGHRAATRVPSTRPVIVPLEVAPCISGFVAQACKTGIETIRWIGADRKTVSTVNRTGLFCRANMPGGGSVRGALHNVAIGAIRSIEVVPSGSHCTRGVARRNPATCVFSSSATLSDGPGVPP